MVEIFKSSAYSFSALQNFQTLLISSSFHIIQKYLYLIDRRYINNIGCAG